MTGMDWERRTIWVRNDLPDPPDGYDWVNDPERRHVHFTDMSDDPRYDPTTEIVFSQVIDGEEHGIAYWCDGIIEEPDDAISRMMQDAFANARAAT